MIRKRTNRQTLSITEQRDAWVDKFLSRDRQAILPPDPEGLNAQGAERGKKLLDLYYKLNPEADEEQFVIWNILHDLIHLCLRNPKLGDLEENLAWAQRFFAEGIWELSDPSELPQYLKRR